jgi:hypothetical protein
MKVIKEHSHRRHNTIYQKNIKQLTFRKAVDIKNAGTCVLLTPDQLTVMVRFHERLFCPIHVAKNAYNREINVRLE